MLKVLQESNMVYLDHASSTKIDPKFAEAAQNMLPRFFANPDAQHMPGYQVKQAMEDSRKRIGKLFNRQANNVFFTASATEANNLAIKGIALANLSKGNHIISVKSEHLSVINSLEYLKKYHGFKVDYLKCDKHGKIDVEQLVNTIQEDTIMVALMAVNNELATIHPIQEIQKLVKKHSKHAVFVVDGVAAVGKINPSMFDVDVLTMSQHKLGGLSGSGCLLKKQHIAMVGLIHGGQQEFSLRAGTPFAVANILFADVLEHAFDQQIKQQNRILDLRNYTFQKLQEIKGVTVVSDNEGSPYIVSFIQEKVHSSIILNVLNAQQVYVSSHSACASESKEPSHVLLACGYNTKQAEGMIRLSFHYDTTIEEIDEFLKAYKKVKDYVQ